MPRLEKASRALAPASKPGRLAFLFKRSEQLPRGVERLLRTELDAARALLSEPSERPLDYRVHEVRKTLKRLRALLTLVKGSVSDALLERLRQLLRTAAHALAELRSSAALAHAFRTLLEDHPNLLDEPVREAIDASLTRASVDEAAIEVALAAAIEALSRARDAARVVMVSGKGWDSIARGFKDTYARARGDFRLAQRSRSVAHLHDFRTNEKRHLYHLSLLEKVWPRLVRAECKELDELGELLGDHHDLSLLLPELERRGLTQLDLGQLVKSIEERKLDLERRIWFHGTRLFSESPKRRTERFAGYHAAGKLRPKKSRPR